MKVCSSCKVEKPLSEFTKHTKGKHGVHHYCKVCKRKQANSNYNYDKSKERGLLYNYQITSIELQVLFDNQKGLCKICGKYKLFVSKRKGLFIDHDHKTGKVRGLLCNSYNSLLGLCNDDINILKKSIEYLENSI